MGASASIGADFGASAVVTGFPTFAEVVEAEAQAQKAGRVHVELAMRAKELRLAHTIQSAPGRIGLRAINSAIRRFMKADHKRAMEKSR